MKKKNVICGYYKERENNIACKFEREWVTSKKYIYKSLELFRRWGSDFVKYAC